MQRLADIDWSNWKPKDVAVLSFVLRGGEALLIRKKRGLGAGKINAPGGRIEPGETPEAAAIRESQEEVGVTPLAPRRRGHLRFQFADGYSLECHVLSSYACEGEPHETDEADPFWSSLHALPYDEMWSDDRLWLPLMLAGRPFRGHFLFDGDRMLDHELVDDDPAAPLLTELARLGVAFERFDHPPVFTVEAARAVRPPGAAHGVHLKNLFVRNKKGAMWLVSAPEERAIHLRDLGARLGAGNLSFGSPERLRENLGVEPGSVTPLAAYVDREPKRVTVVLDRAAAVADVVHCHPLTNDRTLALSGRELVRALTAWGHPPIIVDL